MIHPLTHISDHAKLAQNVKIDPFTIIHENVEIGGGTWVGSNVTIMAGTRIGSNCRIFPGVVIAATRDHGSAATNDYSVEIGNNTTIREYVTINRPEDQSGKTRIGNNCMINAYSSIGHSCTIGNNCVIINCSQIRDNVVMDDWGWVAGLCNVNESVHIGRHAFIAGGSTVDKDIPPFIKAAHVPISYAGINSTGLKRRGFALPAINHILDIYRCLYNSGLPIAEAMGKIEEELLVSEERDEILGFIRRSRKGIVSRNNDR